MTTESKCVDLDALERRGSRLHEVWVTLSHDELKLLIAELRASRKVVGEFSQVRYQLRRLSEFSGWLDGPYLKKNIVKLAEHSDTALADYEASKK